jgi:hypothetical protein
MPLTFILHRNMFSAQNTFLRMGKRLEKVEKSKGIKYNCTFHILLLFFYHPPFSGTLPSNITITLSALYVNIEKKIITKKFLFNIIFHCFQIISLIMTMGYDFGKLRFP